MNKILSIIKAIVQGNEKQNRPVKATQGSTETIFKRSECKCEQIELDFTSEATKTNLKPFLEHKKKVVKVVDRDTLSEDK